MGFWSDAKSIAQRDPAAKGPLEVFFLYSGYHAVCWHRPAHWLYRHGLFRFARIISQFNRFFTGVEIHPGAKIGSGLFIDHGMAIVIGETAEIGDNCTMYHGCTLGGTGKHTGKRHPTIGNNVLIGSGAKILGPLNIGHNVRIGAGSVVLSDIPANTTAVGIPARVVRQNTIDETPSVDLDQIHLPDPTHQEILELRERLEQLAKEVREYQNIAKTNKKE